MGGKNLPVNEVGYSKVDPRVLVIPVPSAATAGQHKFQIDRDPYHFPKAILVDPSGDGYGEMGFNIHAGNDQYIELKSGLFRSLSGEFTQSTGDVAFSQTETFLAYSLTAITPFVCLILPLLTKSLWAEALAQTGPRS